MEIPELEPNSHAYKAQKQKEAQKKEEKTITPVAKGKVAEKKQVNGRRLLEAFLPDGVEGTGQSIIFDLIIPKVWDTVYDILTGSLEAIWYPGTGRPGKKRSNANPLGTISYNKMSETKRRPSARSSEQYKDITFETKAEAVDVLDQLLEMLEIYPSVSVKDYYAVAGVSSDNWQYDNNYGWTNLSRASIQRSRDGWYIDLPRCKQLDD